MNVHIVGTFYQLLLAIENALEAKDEPNHIWVKDTLGKHKVINGITFNTYNNRSKFGLFDLYKGKAHNFYFHQENDIVNIWLAKKIKKAGKKVSINLCSDGTKPYGTFVNKKHKLLSNLKDTLLDQLFLIKNKRFPIFHYSDYYRYGSSGIIDNIHLEYPDCFNFEVNKLSKKIIKQASVSGRSIDIVKKYLDIDYDNRLNDKVIYFGQPISERLAETENEILKQLELKYGVNNILLKLHPKQNKNNSKYQILPNNIPAEVIINNCEKCVLISGWSSCLLHDLGVNNKRIFTYKLFQKGKDKVLDQMQIEPIENITFVDSIKEL